MSGHIFFADDYYGYDDAIYVAARIVQTLSRTKKTSPKTACPKIDRVTPFHGLRIAKKNGEVQTGTPTCML